MDDVRIQILQEEIWHYETLIEPHDCGHKICTRACVDIIITISFLKSRIDNLMGKKEWPFVK